MFNPNQPITHQFKLIDEKSNNEINIAEFLWVGYLTIANAFTNELGYIKDASDKEFFEGYRTRENKLKFQEAELYKGLYNTSGIGFVKGTRYGKEILVPIPIRIISYDKDEITGNYTRVSFMTYQDYNRIPHGKDGLFRIRHFGLDEGGVMQMDFTLANFNANGELVETKQYKVENQFKDTERLRKEFILMGNQFVIPIRINSVPMGMALYPLMKPGLESLVKFIDGLIAKANTIGLRGIVNNKLSKANASLNNLKDQLSGKKKYQGNAVYLLEGLAEDLRDIIFDLKPNADEFSAIITGIRFLREEIQIATNAPIYALANAGRNNKQSSETITNVIGKTNQLEELKDSQELYIKEVYEMGCFYMNKEPQKDFKAKVSVTEILDFAVQPENANKPFENKKNQKIETKDVKDSE